MSLGLSRGKELITEGYGIELSDLPGYDLDDPESSRIDPRQWFQDSEKPFEIESLRPAETLG